MTEDIIRVLTAERTFLQSQNHKLAEVIRQQEQQIHDLTIALQDLKYQLIALHDGDKNGN